MNELLDVVREHKAKYPLMQIKDAVKLIYQSEFGPGHFVECPEQSLLRLLKEYREVAVSPGAKENKKLIENIGNGLCRCYLQELSETELEVLNRIFVYSANSRRGSKESFEQKLQDAKSLFKEAEFSFSEEEYDNYVKELSRAGYPPVSHSETYRKAYRPAYRVIEEKYAPYIELIATIEERRKKQENLIIGIDGNAAAGKTTLAQCLVELYDCEVIHMDEFFLPKELRTFSRMKEAGGNVHYERFAQEVVEGIRSREAFGYQVFSCSEMDYTGVKSISNRKMLVIEGSYALREDFREVYDYKIFMEISEEQQKQRILKRNGVQMYEMFRDKWIPMENHYFEAYKIKAISDYCYSWK